MKSSTLYLGVLSMNRMLFPSMIIFIFVFLSVGPVQAAELNFSVNPVIPDNQLDKDKTYFNLKMDSEQEQTLEVVLSNDTEEDVTVEVNVNQAVTNNNGIIDYNQQPDEYDTSLEYLIEDIVDYDEEVVVEAQSEVTYPITVQMPDDEIEGMILSGIHFQEKEDKEKEDNKEGLENKFAYTVGLQLMMDESDIESDLKLHDIEPTQVNHRNVVTANLQNPEARILAPLEVHAAVFKEKGEEVLFEEENEDVRMAPNSNFGYTIPWDNQPFKPGKYRLELEASNEDDEWSWTEYFEIEDDEAEEYNEKAVELEKDYTKLYIIGGIVLALLLAVIFFWLGRRTNRRGEDDEKDV